MGNPYLLETGCNFADDPDNTTDPDLQATDWDANQANDWSRAGQATETPFFIRLQVTNTDASNDSGNKYWQLFVNTVDNPTTASQVTTSSSPISITDDGGSNDIANGAACDARRCADPGYTLQNGEYTDASDDSEKLDLVAQYYTEFMFCIEGAAAAAGNTYYFYLRFDDGELDEYDGSNTATVTFAGGALSIDESDGVGVADSATVIIPQVFASVSDGVDVADAVAALIPQVFVAISDEIEVGAVSWVWIPTFNFYEITNEITEELSAGLGAVRRLARTSNGDLHCVYHRTISSYKQICYGKSIDGGENWSETQLTTASYDQHSPSIAVDSQDHIHVAWVGRTATRPTKDQVRYRKYTDSWQSIVEITDEDYVQTAGPAIAIDSNDYVHLVWEGYRSGNANVDIRYRKYTTSWQSIENLVGEAYDQEVPCIAIDSNDYIHIAWHGNHSGQTSWDQIRYIKNDGSWSGITNITDDLINQYPSIAIESNDDIHIVWVKTTFHDPSYYNNIWHIEYTTSWQSAENISNEPYAQNPASIAIDKSDYLHVLWYGHHANSSSIRQLRYREYAGSWQGIENLTNHCESQSRPNLIWAFWPSSKCNRPADGFGFLWADDDARIVYGASSDLLWDLSTHVGDGLTIADISSVEIPGPELLEINVGDGIDVADSVDVLIPAVFIDVADGVDVADAPAVLIPEMFVSVADGVGVISSTTTEIPSAEILEVNVTDSLSVGDDGQAIIPALFVDVTDSIDVTSTVSVLIPELFVNVSDEVDVGDLANLLIPALFVQAADSIGLTDSVDAVIPELFISASDGVGLADAPSMLIPELFVSVVDGIGAASAANVSVPAAGTLEISVFDGIGVADTIEALLPELFIDVADGVGVTSIVETVIPDLYVAVSDGLGLADSVAASIATGNLSINVSDGVSVASTCDALIPELFVSATDAVAVTDSPVAVIPELFINVSDGIDLAGAPSVSVVSAVFKPVWAFQVARQTH